MPKHLNLFNPEATDMGLWDKLLGEFIDVIQWIDDSNDTLVYRFERHGNDLICQVPISFAQAALGAEIGT